MLCFLTELEKWSEADSKNIFLSKMHTFLSQEVGRQTPLSIPILKQENFTAFFSFKYFPDFLLYILFWSFYFIWLIWEKLENLILCWLCAANMQEPDIKKGSDLHPFFVTEQIFQTSLNLRHGFWVNASCWKETFRCSIYLQLLLQILVVHCT